MKHLLLALAITASLSACVTAPALKTAPPQGMKATDSVVVSTLPTAQEKFATDLPGTYFGASGASGSLTVGVLFGMIGAVANAAYVIHENRERAKPLNQLTSVNLAEPLMQDFQNTNPATTDSFQLFPSASIFFTSKTDYMLACNVTAKQRATNWQARYTVAMEGTFDATKPNDTAVAADKVRKCIHDAGQLFVDHADGKFDAFEKRTIVSRRIDGKGDSAIPYILATSALPERIVVINSLGLVQLRKSEVKSMQQASN